LRSLKLKTCKHYDKEREMCLGYHASDRPGGWVQKLPGECVFDGRPPQDDKEDKWCLGYEPGKEENKGQG